MLLFKPCENFLPPKIFTTTTNSKPHHLHLHLHHHHHDVKLHFSPPKAHFKYITLSSPLSPPPQPSDSLPPASGSSSSLTTTVDFLMDSGGLSSYEEAIQVIRQVPSLLNNGGRGRPRSVIGYLESIGFSKTRISKVISKWPRLLFVDVEKTLKPKIQLFQDFGFSESDIADLIASKPTLVHRSLKKQMKPALELIKSFVKTDRDLIRIIKRYGILPRSTYRRNFIEPNIHVLRQHGVPDSEIVHLILSNLTTLMLTPKVFKSIVERIVSLGGFKPETRKFLTAVAAMSGMKKATWDSKIDLLKGGLGWSEVQILDAFGRYPIFLMLSRENLKEGIEFFKESLNWDAASFLSQHPTVLTFSLKKRVIPRLAVLKCLMSKEIIKQDKLFKNMLKLTETQFLSKYVFKYQEQLPHLYYEVYKKEDNDEITNQQGNGDIDMTV